jgi:hypothetical protein
VLKRAPQRRFCSESLRDLLSVHREERRLRPVARNPLGVLVVKLVVTSAAAQRNRERERLASTPGPADTLLVVEPHRRHVREHDCLQTADIDADLHRRRDAEDVDLVNGANQRSLASRGSSVNQDIAEEALVLRLIVGLRRELLAM